MVNAIDISDLWLRLSKADQVEAVGIFTDLKRAGDSAWQLGQDIYAELTRQHRFDRPKGSQAFYLFWQGFYNVNPQKALAELSDLISTSRDKRRDARKVARAIGLPAIKQIFALFDDADLDGKVNLLVTLRRIVPSAARQQLSREFGEEQPGHNDLSKGSPSNIPQFAGKDQTIDLLIRAASDSDFRVRRSAALCLLKMHPYVFSQVKRPELILDEATSNANTWLDAFNLQTAAALAGESPTGPLPEAPSNLDQILSTNLDELKLQILYCWSAGCGSITAGGGQLMNIDKHFSAEEIVKTDAFIAQSVALAGEASMGSFYDLFDSWLGTEDFALRLGLESSGENIDVGEINWLISSLIRSIANEPEEDDWFRSHFIFVTSWVEDLAAMILSEKEVIHPAILIDMAMAWGSFFKTPDESGRLAEAIMSSLKTSYWRNLFVAGDHEWNWAFASVHVQAIQALAFIGAEVKDFLKEIYFDQSADPTERMAALYGLLDYHFFIMHMDYDLLFEAGESVRENLDLLDTWIVLNQDFNWLGQDPEFWKNLWLGCERRAIKDIDLLLSIGTSLMDTKQNELAIDCLKLALEIADNSLALETVSKIRNSLAAAYFLEGRNQDVEGLYPAHETDYRRLIDEGENEKVEFKASLKYDYKQKIKNPLLEQEVVQAIAAFMNSNGGTLFIGVADNGDILGLEHDFKQGQTKNKDGFLCRLILVVGERLGKEFYEFFKPEIILRENKYFCVTEVKASDEPVFLKDTEEFFIRSGPTTHLLGTRKAHQYICKHWCRAQRSDL